MDEFIGIVKLFAGTYAPKGWMFCDGRLLSISQNTALFSLLGTTYGGDGVSTFALPNLIGRMALGAGNVSSKSYPLGIVAGNEQNTISAQNLPNIGSGFQLKVSNANANLNAPTQNASIGITGTSTGREFTTIPSYVDASPNTTINSQSISFTGQNLPVNNMPPYVGLNYIICIYGIYPPRD